ncbi:phosphoesterase [Asticcacaulis sp. 201]|uniref:phosphoesterase n=1 Tax=Asticcacaulis sp. 201 TaxID=3028787 RepID=UPI0029163404|nr:phosphoesterase [Asticcacaulis sp. 201]MDV6330334.1 phosphoesterase [Asticcacaulis sp. 201]
MPYRLCLALLALTTAGATNAAMTETRTWQAGDHHVHSRYSGRFKDGKYVLGTDGIYPMVRNAEEARRYGLSWMVAVDHGGPGLSVQRAEQAYPELLAARRDVPEVIQFYGMELDTPGGDHSSLIMPLDSGERDGLRHFESAYAKDEVEDPARDTTAKMLQMLREMTVMTDRPVIIANHPSRSALGVRDYHGHTPAELRAWNDTAPDIAVGMEGAPGHQGASLKPGVMPQTLRARGYYEKSPTFGGFDAMTATVGGVWDSLLGEGRHFWITASSDSHRNIADGGEDFWPGQYAKTYVLARHTPEDILDGLRKGRVFVTTGDLVSELDMDVAGASIGGTAHVKSGHTVTIKIRLRDPAGANAHGDHPAVKRIDLIMGNVTGKAAPDADTQPSARVVKRFTAADWTRDGEIITLSYRFTADKPAYIRLRGTSTDEAEPLPDPVGENPWPDLWVYSNPVFIELK